MVYRPIESPIESDIQMKTKNLFGEMVEIAPKSTPPPRSPYQLRKAAIRYRKSTGDKRCGNCRHHERYEYHNKYYHKCALIGYSNSEATDIRVSSVCDEWQDAKQ